jgi:hypothetical protein
VRPVRVRFLALNTPSIDEAIPCAPHGVSGYLRDQITSGPPVAIDDRRFDSMWEACGALGPAVAIHVADPKRSSGRSIFDRYQDRVLFGTDTTPGRAALVADSYVDATYRIYFRFFETDDEYFHYSPSAIPPQGRWRIYGLALPRRDPSQGLFRVRRAAARTRPADLRSLYTGFLPWITRISTIAIARMSRMWMNPPSV